MNPYSGIDFFTFFLLLFQRIGAFLSGELAFKGLASDEVQLVVLSLVSLSAALVGTFLLLRKMMMLANSLSHTILLGIVLAFLLVTPAESAVGSAALSLHTLLIASLITAVATSLLTQLFTQLLRLQEDASIGLVFTTLFALGVVFVTLFTRSSHLGAEAVMGNADALHLDDIQLIFWVTLGNLLVILLFYKEMQITAFAPSLGKGLGISPALFSYLLMVQTSATITAAFRSVGVLLVLAFLTGPVLSARLFALRLRGQLWLASLFGILASAVGVALSRHLLSVYQLPLSTAGLVVAVIALLYLVSLLFHAVFRRSRRARPTLSI